MMFPLSEQEWYKKRDDRTKRVDGASGFEDFSVGVIVSPQIKTSYPIQVMTVTSLNMLARWCRKIRIQLPYAVSCLPSNRGENLENFLQKHLQMIDPYGQFTFGDINANECAHTLFIGSPEKKQEQLDNHSVWIDGRGWISGIGRVASSTAIKQNNDLNPVGAAFASCLGVAELFRQAVGLPASSNKPVWYSLYDCHKVNDPIGGSRADYVSGFDFGRIHQVGCGAVASSLDFLLSLTDWKADLCLIDYDRVEVTNCNRSLAFTACDAVTSRSKVDSCADVLRDDIVPIKFEGSYGEFVKAGKFLDLPADLILCLANEQNVWATIQNNLPPLTLHATTTPNWGVNLGRHIPKKEWCILCRFSKDIEYSFKPVCGEVEIKNSGKTSKTVLGVLPFLSATAAVLILAEMAKMPLPNYPVNNDFVEFSTKSMGADFLQHQRKATDTCICNGQTPEFFEHITKTKFWRFST